MISDAASTERPSQITDNLYIGGALAARSMYTLQHLGITHILCLCSNEIGQADSQYPYLFDYRNFSVSLFLISHIDLGFFGKTLVNKFHHSDLIIRWIIK